MDEMVPRSTTQGAAGWDGAERRARPAPEARRGRWSALRSPACMSGAVLASAGATWLVEGVGFVVRLLQIAVHWH